MKKLLLIPFSRVFCASKEGPFCSEDDLGSSHLPGTNTPAFPPFSPSSSQHSHDKWAGLGNCFVGDDLLSLSASLCGCGRSGESKSLGNKCSLVLRWQWCVGIEKLWKWQLSQRCHISKRGYSFTCLWDLGTQCPRESQWPQGFSVLRHFWSLSSPLKNINIRAM